MPNNPTSAANEGVVRNALLKAVRVIDATSPFHHQTVDIRYRQGEIIEIAAANSIKAHDNEQVIDDQYVSPGWVAMSCELNEPGYETRDTLATLAASAVAGGFTDVVVQPTSKPVIDEGAPLLALIQRTQNLDIKLHIAGALTKGLKGEALAGMAEMAALGIIAFSDGPKPDLKDDVLLKCLEYTKLFGKPILQVPMDADLAHGGQVNEGPNTVGLGLTPFPEPAEDLMVAKLIRLAEYAEATHIHFSPITAAKSLSLIQTAQKQGLAVSAGVSPYHLFFTDADLQSFDSWLKFYPPLRDDASRKSLVSGILDGTISTIDMHHAPKMQEEKELEFDYAAFGAPVLETAFAMLNSIDRRESYSIGIERFVQLLTHGPRKILGLPEVSIQLGKKLSLTVFNPDTEWVVNKSKLKTLYRSSPMLNSKLTGKVVAVLV